MSDPLEPAAPGDRPAASDPTALAYDSLDGLSVGDALGAQFFVPGRSPADLVAGRLPESPWEWTDDTEMACSVVAELRDHGEVLPDRLAAAFADRCEPYRGYGPGAVVILHRIRDSVPWREAAGAAFGGAGSCGNGAAMRVAPLGARFAREPAVAAEQAARSAEVTHLHPEGVAGAVAVALAAATAAAARLANARPAPEAFLDAVLERLPDGEIRRGIVRARALLGRSAAEAAYELGNGSRVTAQDTVPFTLWLAATHLTDYPAAVTACVVAGGDADTTAAITGGIVAAHTGHGDRPGVRGIPAGWLAAREPLPAWSAPSVPGT
ncbi:ADP-ribosylglycohydrolase family protein [Streptomyces litchfieldiae]|uniref:ADP-ribosylglycohydrolase family protein n=1 Tax=Streptomyces litchfieldiae TaxID=3075543 RepID=UPI00374E0A38